MREHTVHCEACEANVVPVRPNGWWKVANVGVWAFIIVGGPFIAVMPPLNVVTIPIFFVAASAMVGAVSNELARAASCPRCGRDVPLTPPALAGRLARPAHERLVERALVGKPQLVRDLGE